MRAAAWTSQRLGCPACLHSQTCSSVAESSSPTARPGRTTRTSASNRASRPRSGCSTGPTPVGDLHRRFVEAGSELVLTCTFGGHAGCSSLDGPLAGRARRGERPRGRARARRHRRGVASSRARSGLTGQLDRAVRPADARSSDVEAFARAGEVRSPTGGVDLFVLETFFTLEEALWAVEGVPERFRASARPPRSASTRAPGR